MTKGQVAIVDSEDYAKVSEFTWKYSNRGYAASNYYASGKYKTRLMHRLIMDAPKGVFVDHIDGDPLNNRKENLRLVTNIQNTWNQGISTKNTSGFRGVTVKHPKNENQRTRYEACIKKAGRSYYLGYFDTPQDAARMYNFWAHDMYGEYARLNIINKSA